MILEHTLAIALCLTTVITGGDDDPPNKNTARVTLKQDVRLRGAEVLLRDLAEIKSDDPRLVDRLRKISFGPRPAHTHNRVLSQQDVRQKLFREGLLARELKIDGAREVVVLPLTTIIKRQELLAVATPALEAVLAIERVDVEHKARSSVGSMRVPPGRRSLDMRARLHETRNEISACINVDILVDGEVFKTVRVYYDLKRFHRVLTARAVIDRDQPLGPHNLVYKRVEKPHGSSVHLTDMNSVKGKVSARKLRAGELMTLSELILPAVVHKNEIVHLVSISGRIKIATRVQALSDGSVGSFIPVQTMHYKSPRRLTAKVQGPGLVVIIAAR